MSPVDGCRSSAVRTQGQPSGQERLRSIVVSLQCRARSPRCPIRRPFSESLPLQLPSRSPETVAVEAVAEVKQLQAAIGVLGETSVHAMALHEALRVAQNKAKLPPIQEQLESCKTFLDRARKRVLRAQAVIDRATEQKAVYESEVAEGQCRLEALQVEAAHKPDEPGVSKHSAKWMEEGPSCFENIPAMPTTNVQELEGWISDRNCELRNAMEFGDSSLMAKIGLLVGQRATQLRSMGRDVPMAGQSKSSVMSSLIDAAEAKRRCIAAGSASGAQQ